MGQAARVLPPVMEAPRGLVAVPLRPQPEFHFHSLVLTEARSLVKGRGITAVVSLAAHAVLLSAIVLIPILFFEDNLPASDRAVRAFFVAAPEVAPPPPPPPPPPAAGVRPKVQAPAVVPPPDPGRFVAPIEVPAQIVPDEGIDLGGVEGGVPGGVEGGVPGGVIGGVVGGLPTDAPPPPPQMVRIGGKLKAPKRVHGVAPVYPELALQARIRGMVVVEAQVGPDGRVTSVKIVQGAPVFDEAALAAVKQWRYAPLLLNGIPTPFILTVTVSFNLMSPNSP